MPSLLRARSQRSRQTLASLSLAALVASGIPLPAAAASDEPTYRFIEVTGDSAAATDSAAAGKVAPTVIDPQGRHP